MTDNELLITADTIVVTYGQPDRILGKPADREEAIEMLCHLSGHVHEVITGVCLTTKQKTVSFPSLRQSPFPIWKRMTLYIM